MAQPPNILSGIRRQSSYNGAFPVGDPLLIVDTTAFTDQQLVEFTISYYRADRYQYSTTHTYSP